MICRICGNDKREGEIFSEWVKGTFTNFDNLCPGEIICSKCLVMFDERSEELARIVEKEKPQRMRNYSHFILDGKWIPLGKDRKARMSDLLLNYDCEYAVISESGQKHIWFRAQSGMWQFEEYSIIPDKGLLLWLLSRVEKLLDVFSKGEMRTGRYNHKRILDFGLMYWKQIEDELKRYRGNPYFALALFLGRKDGEFRKHCPKSTCPDLARVKQRVQEEILSLDLGAV